MKRSVQTRQNSKWLASQHRFIENLSKREKASGLSIQLSGAFSNLIWAAFLPSFCDQLRLIKSKELKKTWSRIRIGWQNSSVLFKSTRKSAIRKTWINSKIFFKETKTIFSRRLQDQIGRLNSIPKRKEEYSRQFTNKTDRQLNQVKSALQQVDQDEIQRFKEEYDEEDVSDEELVNPNSPEEILRYGFKKKFKKKIW